MNTTATLDNAPEGGDALHRSNILAFDPEERPPSVALARSLRGLPPRQDGEPIRLYDPRPEIAIESHTAKVGKKHRLHRTDGPAFKTHNGKTGEQIEEWHLDGKWHRMDGPAIIEPDPNKPGAYRERWSRDGKPYTPTPAEKAAWAEKVQRQGGAFFVEPTSPDIHTADFKAAAAKQAKKDEAERDRKKNRIRTAAERASQGFDRGLDKVARGAKYILSTADELSR